MSDSPLIAAMDELSRSDKKLVLHGRQYSPVALRVEMLRKHFGQTLSIITEIIDVDESSVIAKASVAHAGEIIATGYAEEFRVRRGVNASSALENAETSAIGRALANLGLVGGEYASADELTGAIVTDNSPISEAQAATIEALVAQVDRSKEDFLAWLKIDDVSELPLARYQTVKETLEQAIAKQEKGRAKQGKRRSS